MRNVTSGYLSAPAITDISLYVSEAEIVTLLGANGAGKTTTLKTISGILRPWRGSITLDGSNIAGSSPFRIVRSGVAHVPEGRRILPELTVGENLAMGAYTINDKSRLRELKTEVLDLFPSLKKLLSQKGGSLSGGEQQMLAVARALMIRPKYLLLDEPSMGLAPVIVEKIFELLPRLREQGLGILLVEQNAAVALDVADRGYVIERGKIVDQGPSKRLSSTPGLQAAYLGF